MDFEELSSILAARQLMYSPAELHGMLCGQLCAGVEPDIGLTLELLELDGEAGEELRALLLELVGHARLQLQRNDYSFQPLLPDDDEELALRLLALGQWCEAFNTGFGLGFGKSGSAILPETREVLTDFAAIAQLDEQPEGPAEQNEEHCMQLQEYVRMAAISLYLQNNKQQTAGFTHSNDEGSENLH